ncbi:pyridoxal phosphate-dependent aminotransferase [Sulfoacidibacillus thermotolerans]|uniref:Aminotransferase class I/classII large domain-containing protein n=1 Tax=Sulfoacidibacillus thermotolerans TaxID=1765684 RepID=A0A2U3D777_SULT2|nr:aminotransferase class I/II-fold pyridoxal phosphate-dependent enzyme [Sulfoacidibacillus thermotolerans]PWI57103.1 hypothetical protein BM613_10110 [Sulfoacidibacillus thermotolerans]
MKQSSTETEQMFTTSFPSSLKWSNPPRIPLLRQGLASPEGSIRLNANESPLSPIPEVEKRMVAASMRVNRYPEVTASTLRSALGQQLGILPSQIMIGNGSSELIHLLTSAFGSEGTEVIVPTPSFPLYATSVTYTGATLVTVPIHVHEGTMDLDAMNEAITERTSLLFLCNPNNPTGGYTPLEKIKSFLYKIPPHVAIVLDEAYWELTDSYIRGDKTAVDLCKQFPNLIILRTFSKFYGLAGLRIGYAIVHNEQMALRLAGTRPLTMPNTVGLEAALACLEFHEAYQQRAHDTMKERTRVLHSIRSLGYSVFPSQTNFYCIHFPLGTAPFQSQGIHIRDGLTIQMPEYIRITLGTFDENQRVLDVLRTCTPHAIQSAKERGEQIK